jgi:nucleotide-binding universal stress UspA family protein
MTVVAGVDESPVSKVVAARATDLQLVHVAYAPMLYADVPIDWSGVVEAQRKLVWEQLEPIIEGADVAVETVDLDGYPPEALVDYTTEVDASLLVVGTRGRGDLASLILGSTSHRAIHSATCDVLVVKADG